MNLTAKNAESAEMETYFDGARVCDPQQLKIVKTLGITL